MLVIGKDFEKDPFYIYSVILCNEIQVRRLTFTVILAATLDEKSVAYILVTKKVNINYNISCCLELQHYCLDNVGCY